MGIFSKSKKKVEQTNKKPEEIDWSKAHQISDQFAEEVFNHLETTQNVTSKSEKIKKSEVIEEQLVKINQEDVIKLVVGSVSTIAVLVGIIYSIVWVGMMIGTILAFVAIGYFIAVVLPSYQQGVPINHQEKISELIEGFSKGYRNAVKKEEEKKTVKGRMKRALKTVGEIVMDSD